mmetsp:Transcript_47894/g.119842  ORF Transcript_47894/g.119842 Transcript_47894/m.119842 type:complete len:83 (-) Transcript_47894:64-312(-)
MTPSRSFIHVAGTRRRRREVGTHEEASIWIASIAQVSYVTHPHTNTCTDSLQVLCVSVWEERLAPSLFCSRRARVKVQGKVK